MGTQRTVRIKIALLTSTLVFFAGGAIQVAHWLPCGEWQLSASTLSRSESCRVLFGASTELANWWSLPPLLVILIICVVGAYLITYEALKHIFLKELPRIAPELAGCPSIDGDPEHGRMPPSRQEAESETGCEAGGPRKKTEGFTVAGGPEDAGGQQVPHDEKLRFISTVSHELRTPIHSILGMLRILSKDEANPERKSYMGMASEAAYSLLDTINKILDFSASKEDEFTLDNAPFILRDCIADALRVVAPKVQRKGHIELLYEIQPEVGVEYFGDRARLKQALVNILDNAVKFTDRGCVSLCVSRRSSSRPDRDTILFRINDTGIGLQNEDLGDIFEPFVQGDKSVARAHAGTGLGLTIVRQIVKAMEGAVWVEESSHAQGATFLFTVEMKCTTPAVTADAAGANEMHVTILDDTSRWSSFVAQGLQRLGVSASYVDEKGVQRVDTFVSQTTGAGFLVITGRALQRSELFQFLVQRVCEMSAESISDRLVVVLDPSEHALRGRLLALGISVLSGAVVSAEELLGLLRRTQRSPGIDGSSANAEASGRSMPRSLEVLIADDARTNRIILTAMLEDAGHQVTAVENGVGLLKRLEPMIRNEADAIQFDLVLTDVQMPLMDGLTVARKVRALERAYGTEQHLPIIAVTAHARPEEAESMLSAGIDAVLTKPIEPDQLTEAIEGFCGAISAESGGDETKEVTIPHQIELGQLSAVVWSQWMEIGANGLTAEFGDVAGSQTVGQVLDLNDIYERMGCSVPRSILVLQAFASCYRELLSNLMTARSGLDPASLRFAAHAIKGLLLDIGSHVPAKVAAQLESFALDNKMAETQHLSTQLGVHVLLVARLIDGVLRKLGIAGQLSEEHVS